MAKMKAADLIKGLKYAESEKSTFYSNDYPYNCGYIHANAVQSWDCIGLVKGPINEPDILYRKSPVGYYVRPGQVIPDTSEYGLLTLCTSVVWGDFRNMSPAEYLYMAGHGGWFVGEYEDPSGIVNTIEATGAMGGGVRSSYVSATGYRYDHKGGTCLGRWEAHGKLSSYIEYERTDPWIELVNGEWCYVVNGSVDYNYTGLGQNENGWWYCKNGKVDFTYNGVVQNENGWWKVENGQVNFNYTGLAKNENGWWYLKNGKVDFYYNGVVQNEYGWWVVINGKVDFAYHGLASNQYGWWYCRDGKVDFEYNGLCVNQNGIWVIEKGKVNFDYSGDYKFSGSTFRIQNGKVV